MNIKNKDRKKIVLFSAILLFLLVALFITIQHKKDKNNEIRCSTFSNTGEAIMIVRQADLPKEYVIDSLLKGEDDKVLIDLVNASVFEAYETPLYDLSEDKEKAIADFKEASYDFCKQNM